jgi:hypothetical protein
MDQLGYIWWGLMGQAVLRPPSHRGQRKTWCIGPYAGVDYNLTYLSTSDSTPHARVDYIPQSGTLDLASGFRRDFKMGYLLHLKYRRSYGCHSRSFRALSYVYIISTYGFMLYIA